MITRGGSTICCVPWRSRSLLSVTRPLAAAAGCLLLLAGCAGGGASEPGSDPAGTPRSGEMEPVELVDMWRVSAAGEEERTWLRLSEEGAVVWRECGALLGSWQAGDGVFLAGIDSMSGACGESGEGEADWLTRAWGYRPADAEGAWELVDADGQVTATMTVDGLPEGTPDVAPEYAEAPQVTDATREFLAEPAPLPDGESPASEDDVLGRWVPRGGFDAEPYIELAEDGTWSGSDGCNGLGASGGWPRGCC